MKNVFDLEPKTEVDRANSYIRSYPGLLRFSEGVSSFDDATVIQSAHMVYGWMPTVLSVHGDEHQLQAVASILNNARAGENVSKADIETVAGVVNKSIVGASKLLHFVAPSRFPIWDSKIYGFVHGKKAYHASVNDVDKYVAYIDILTDLSRKSAFAGFHESVERKLGYSVAPMRSLEMVMFLNA